MGLTGVKNGQMSAMIDLIAYDLRIPRDDAAVIYLMLNAVQALSPDARNKFIDHIQNWRE